MQVSDCVDTALTRARQARLPSPWTEAVDFLGFPQSHARQCSTFWLARAARSRKSTASVQGEGKRAWRARVRAASTDPRIASASSRSSQYTPFPHLSSLRGERRSDLSPLRDYRQRHI